MPHFYLVADCRVDKLIALRASVNSGGSVKVSLSADHRVLDGVLAAQWLSAFVKRIENPLTILI